MSRNKRESAEARGLRTIKSNGTEVLGDFEELKFADSVSKLEPSFLEIWDDLKSIQIDRLKSSKISQKIKPKKIKRRTQRVGSTPFDDSTISRDQSSKFFSIRKTTTLFRKKKKGKRDTRTSKKRVKPKKPKQYVEVEETKTETVGVKKDESGFLFNTSHLKTFGDNKSLGIPPPVMRSKEPKIPVYYLSKGMGGRKDSNYSFVTVTSEEDRKRLSVNSDAFQPTTTPHLSNIPITEEEEELEI